MILLLVFSATLVEGTRANSLPLPPIMVGWGTKLEEASEFSATNQSSQVFAGEQSSKLEMEIVRSLTMGFNAVRVSFESQCTTWKEAGLYDSTYLNRSFKIAEHFSFWLIVDYHGFNDTASEPTIQCWLGFWAGLVQQFKSEYARTIWEPLNEPTGLGFNHTAVGRLNTIYQRWINQTRELGDRNWIVVQNLCSFRCDFDDKALGYPTVIDPAGMVLISLHPYMSFRNYWRTWDNSTAESRALMLYNAMIDGAQNTGWPILNTEGGPGGTFNGTSRCPDLVLTGSAGYCKTNFHFIQTLTNLLDGHSPARVSWIWWTMSADTNTPGAGLYGALNTWGAILEFVPFVSGDVNGDGVVDIDDVLLVSLAWGGAYNPNADFNANGVVDLDDVLAVGTQWG